MTIKDTGIMMSNWGEIPLKVEFDEPTGKVNKTDGIYNAVVKLSRLTQEIVKVHYSTSDGTARNIPYGTGKNFESASGDLIFNPGEISKSVQVNIVNNPNADLDRFLRLLLAILLINVTLGMFFEKTMIILDNTRVSLIDVTEFNEGGLESLDKTDSYDNSAKMKAIISYVYLQEIIALFTVLWDKNN